jgi:hypothetical protein
VGYRAVRERLFLFVISQRPEGAEKSASLPYFFPSELLNVLFFWRWILLSTAWGEKQISPLALRNDKQKKNSSFARTPTSQNRDMGTHYVTPEK